MNPGNAPPKQETRSSGGSSIDLNYRLICKYCKKYPPNIIEDYKAGDLVCGDCGLVFPMRIIDQRSEWRTFSDENNGDDPSRVGEAENLVTEGIVDSLSTQISYRDNHTGTSAALTKAQIRASGMVKGDRDIMDSFRQITHLTERIGLPKVVSDRAKQLYKKIFDEDYVKGKPNNHVIASCIFLACRQEKIGRTFKEIAQLTRVDKKNIARCVKAIIPLIGEAVQSASTEDYLARFCSHLNLDITIQNAAKEVVSKVSDIGVLSGRSPLSIAACAIFVVSQLSDSPKSEKEISPVAGVSESTIRHAYRDLYPYRHQIIPKSFPLSKKVDSLPFAEPNPTSPKDKHTA